MSRNLKPVKSIPPLPLSDNMKTSMEGISIVETKEGSHTLYNSTLHEHYHSMLGALQESMHVFIRNGFCKALENKKDLSILEMGFGTGLNAILTFRENQIYHKRVHYTGIDIQPLPLPVVNKLNYFRYFGNSLQPVFEKMHAGKWFEWLNIDYPFSAPLPKNQKASFSLLKIETDILDHRFEDHYDLIYYDAFSPAHQSQLWQGELFRKIYEVSNKGAVLVTHYAKDEVKKTLESVGFTVEVLPGLMGKKEMLRATK